MKINFFDNVQQENKKTSFNNFCESYLFLDGISGKIGFRKINVVSKGKFENQKMSLSFKIYCITALKIASYVTIIIPLIAISCKLVYRSSHSFKTMLVNNEKFLKPNNKQHEIVQEVIGPSKPEKSTTDKLKDCFSHVYLINMDTMPQRIKQLESHLNQIGQNDFSFTRISAVVGRTRPQQEIEKMSRSDSAIRNGKDDRAGRLGCYLSHLNVLKLARDERMPNILILEDDVRFMPNLLAAGWIGNAMKELPKDWGIFYLGHYDVEKDKAVSYSEHLVKPVVPYDCHAWMVNGSMFDTLIDALENELKIDNGQMRALDVVIAEEITKGGRIYAAKQNIAIQDEGQSSIVGGHVWGNYQKELKELHKEYPNLPIE